MLTEQRKQWLLECLKRDGRLVAKDLSRELSISEDTIRRDLRDLAREGHLLRVHGGALPASPTVANLAARRVMAPAEKVALGRAAAQLIEPRQHVFIDGGTTHMELLRAIPLDLDVTLITHSPAIAAALEHHQGKVILIGGTLFRHSMVSVGAETERSIARIHTDIAFVGLTGLHHSHGGTTGDYEEALIKQAIVAGAAEAVALVTHEKLGAVSPYTVCATNDLDVVVLPKGSACEPFSGTAVKIIEAEST